MLKVYYADITPLFQPQCYERNIRLVEAARQEKIEKYRMEKDRCRSLAAGLLLREAVREEGLEMKQVSVTEREGGKPVFVDGEYFFNLSHAGNFAVCAFADCEVGVDIEEYSRFTDKEKNERIATRILTPREWEHWQMEESGWELLRFWTKKESFAKMTGKGLGCVFSSIDTESGIFYQETDFGACLHLAVCTLEEQHLPLRFFQKMIE